MPIAVLFAALLWQAPPQPQQATPDTSLFIEREALIRIYTDCDEARWPWGTQEQLVPKSARELAEGVTRRLSLEDRWRHYFAAGAGDTIPVTPDSAWVYPLAVRGRLLDNFNNPREGGPHEALDIFVQREGVTVRTPVSGVVVASGDAWQGHWKRHVGLEYEGGGLSRRAGNGVMIFNPLGSTYVYFAHLQPGILVRTGDVVRAGQPLGRVGHTGNASQPGHGKHLHFAFKRSGTECGQEDVLMSTNPYPMVRAARARMP